jgi:hypothetical protein
MKIRQRWIKGLLLGLTILLISSGLAQADQNKFWGMDLGNYWDYVESPYDTWPSRVQVTTLDTASFPYPTYLLASTEYQNGPWVPMENRWYEIRETGPNASELRVWKIMSYDDVDQAWYTFVFDSGIIWAKRPMTVGDSWTSSASGTYSEGTSTSPIDITVNSAVVAYESVNLPFGNGTYNAYKIVHFIQVPGVGQLIQTLWVAPYLGIIKNEAVDVEMTERDYLSSMDIATVFNDALYGYWAYPYIMRIYDEGITAGIGGGLYGPENNVTREEMAVFLLKARNEIPPDGYCGSTPPFADVLPDRWSCKWIKRLFELEITAGIGGGLFGPGNNITRAEMAVFLTRAFLD